MTGSFDETAKVWDVQTGTELMTLTGHSGRVSSVVYSPDGRRIVTGSFDKIAKVWDAQTSIELMTLTSHEGRVFSAVYSAVGKRELRLQVMMAYAESTPQTWMNCYK